VKLSGGQANRITGKPSRPATMRPAQECPAGKPARTLGGKSMRSWKSSVFVAGLAAVAVSGLLFGGTTAAEARTLKWAHVYETSSPYHTWAVWVAEEIKKRSNGELEIEVFPASSLGKESDINEGLTLGTVDLIY